LAGNTGLNTATESAKPRPAATAAVRIKRIFRFMARLERVFSA
jgi:hypothetical protein